MWIEGLRKQAQQAPEAYQAYVEQQQRYWTKLMEARTTDEAIAKRPSLAALIFLILGAPFALYGWVNNLLAGYLPKLASEKLDLYIGYTASVQILCGLLSFPVFYALQSWAIGAWLGRTAGWLYLLSLPLTGWLYLKWQPVATKFKNRQKAKSMKHLDEVKAERAKLLKATLQYLNP
jgi:hypothetical protein